MKLKKFKLVRVIVSCFKYYRAILKLVFFLKESNGNSNTVDVRSKMNNPTQAQGNVIRSLNQMPTLNIVKRKARSVEKYEDDDTLNQEEEQKYVIDDDEILMNRLRKRSQIKNHEITKEKNETDEKSLEKEPIKHIENKEKEFNYFYSDKEPIKFLDKSMSEDSKNELLIEKSLFDEKNYFENMEKLNQKLIRKKQIEKNKDKSAKNGRVVKSNFSTSTDYSIKYEQKKIHSLLDKIQNIYEKIDAKTNESNNKPLKTKTNPKSSISSFNSKLKYSSTSIPRVITTFNKVLNADTQSKSRTESTQNLNLLDKGDSSMDWAGQIPNDSEKTIYESFYELLDTNRRNDPDGDIENTESRT